MWISQPTPSSSFPLCISPWRNPCLPHKTSTPFHLHPLIYLNSDHRSEIRRPHPIADDRRDSHTHPPSSSSSLTPQLPPVTHPYPLYTNPSKIRRAALCGGEIGVRRERERDGPERKKGAAVTDPGTRFGRRRCIFRQPQNTPFGFSVRLRSRQFQFKVQSRVRSGSSLGSDCSFGLDGCDSGYVWLKFWFGARGSGSSVVWLFRVHARFRFRCYRSAASGQLVNGSVKDGQNQSTRVKAQVNS
ncbi:uncharacterized protein LOC110870524 [Helianthus annuus]|uniref:uncharacterized protein LOC110870524 n=1 Tax=Helianthus annuus TaxID=4232 RepID=UPI000B909D86|nr:uncharacterized protein LOC110870524 [Helianthus annuus]